MLTSHPTHTLIIHSAFTPSFSLCTYYTLTSSYLYNSFPPLFLSVLHLSFFFFFLNDPATPEISPLSLHDALPISPPPACERTIARTKRHAARRRTSTAPMGPI